MMYKFQDITLSIDERVKDLLAQLTLEEKLNMLTNVQSEVPRLGIERWHIGLEVARGVVKLEEGKFSTVFPQPIGMAASFDPELMHRIGEVAGVEARIYHDLDASSSLMLFGPTVDMERDPRWGRNEEAYGEDPCLTGKMTTAFTLGLRGKHEKYLRVLPALKHFYANNHEEERFTDNATIPPRVIREYYLKAFEPAIRSGAAPALMTAYNQINGIEGVSNREIDEICKKEWGLLFAVSDGGDFIHNVLLHKTYKNHAESFAKILPQGADLMTDIPEVVCHAAKGALKQNLITEKEIDNALVGVFKGRFLLGEFDPKEANPYANYDKKRLCCDAHLTVSREAAQKAIILLKNNGILPLKKQQKIAVIGPSIDENYRDWYTGHSIEDISVIKGILAKAGGDQVHYDNAFDHIAIKALATNEYLSVGEDASVYAKAQTISKSEMFERNDWGSTVSTFRSLINDKYLTEDEGMNCSRDEAWGWYVKEIIKVNTYDDVNVLSTWDDKQLLIDQEGRLTARRSSNITPDKQFQIEVVSDGISRAATLAKQSDVALVFVGNHPLINAREMYDRKDIQLPTYQERLVQAVYAANPNTVLVMISSYPYAINWEDKHLPAIIHSSHLGPHLGTAMADILYGDSNPAGRSPLTWYKSIYDLPSICDYNIQKCKTTYQYFEGTPLYAFGHGLSYTQFTYSRLEISKTHYAAHESIEVKFLLKNEGDFAGDEVVQLYISAKDSLLSRPKKELKAFQRVSLTESQEREVHLSVDLKDLYFWDVNTQSYQVESGDYEVLIGASSTDIRLKAIIHVDGFEYKGKIVNKMFDAINVDDYHGMTIEATYDFEHYVCTEDWQSFIVYHHVLMEDYTRFEVIASNPYKTEAIDIINQDTNESIGSCIIAPTGSYNDFATFSCDIPKQSGLCNMILKPRSGMGIMKFKFLP